MVDKGRDNIDQFLEEPSKEDKQDTQASAPFADAYKDESDAANAQARKETVHIDL